MDVLDDGGIMGQENLGVAVGHAGKVFLAVFFDFFGFPDHPEEIRVAGILVFYPDFNEDAVDRLGFIGVDKIVRVLSGLIADGFRDGSKDEPENGSPFPFRFGLFFFSAGNRNASSQKKYAINLGRLTASK